MPPRQILSRPSLGRPPAVDEKGRRRTLQATADLMERVDEMERRIDDQDVEIAALKAEAKRRLGGRPKKSTAKARPKKAGPRKVKGKAKPSNDQNAEITP